MVASVSKGWCELTRIFLRMNVSVPQYDDKADRRADEHEGVGKDKHHISNQPAIDDKTRGSRDLSDEQPFGDAFARSLLPLSVNLGGDRHQ